MHHLTLKISLNFQYDLLVNRFSQPTPKQLKVLNKWFIAEIRISRIINQYWLGYILIHNEHIIVSFTIPLYVALFTSWNLNHLWMLGFCTGSRDIPFNFSNLYMKWRVASRFGLFSIRIVVCSARAMLGYSSVSHKIPSLFGWTWYINGVSFHVFCFLKWSLFPSNHHIKIPPIKIIKGAFGHELGQNLFFRF